MLSVPSVSPGDRQKLNQFYPPNALPEKCQFWFIKIELIGVDEIH
jgi:hypothetical protein